MLVAEAAAVVVVAVDMVVVEGIGGGEIPTIPKIHQEVDLLAHSQLVL